jgi:hypothetical protein
MIRLSSTLSASATGLGENENSRQELSVLSLSGLCAMQFVEVRI